MKHLLIALYFFVQGEIPFKSSDEFQVNIEMKFKTKPLNVNPNTYSAGGIRLDQNTGAVSPFLVVNVTNLKIATDEVRMRANDSEGKVLLRKKSSSENLRFEMGFVDEMKSGATASGITLYFLSADKKELRKIVFTVNKDGDFLVNDKWHGKF